MLRVVSGAAFCALLTTSQAQTNYQQLLSFGPSSLSGSQPRGQLLEASDGWLYGTTYAGGASNSGTIFRIGKDGSGFSQVYAFTENDRPQGGLVEVDDGALCGTTSSGGTNHSGTVYRCNKDGSEYVLLHVFPASAGDGKMPICTLTKGLDGILYGTTYSGGVSNLGTVFALGTNGSGYTVLHDFTGTAGGADGSSPFAGVCQGLDGALYGTTLLGGSNNLGTAFKIGTNGANYVILHHFKGGTTDGRWLYGGLVQASNGRLYGTTYYGGTTDVGTIFGVDPDGGNYAVLRSFSSDSQGLQPFTGLVAGNNNVLYGTTRYGGASDGGTVFSVNHDGTGFAVLHRFTVVAVEGSQPLAPLVMGSDGAVYGTTYWGGVYVTNNVYGTLFRLCSPPVITAQPLDQSVTAGQDANFSVTATGTLPLSYQWLFNGADIPGATTSSYTRNNAQPTDEGSYSVVITNMAGSVTSSNAILTLNVPPVITTQPQDQNVNQGSNAVFSVAATGTPTLAYQWRFDGTNIAGATDSSYELANAQPADAGSYSVVVTNMAGSVTSSNAILTVNVPPAITTQPQGQIVIAGQSAIFTVSASGTAPLSYQWCFNTIPIEGATESAYTRVNVQNADAGSYSVIITNVAGSVTSADAVLTINVLLTTTASGAGTVHKYPDQAAYPLDSAVTLVAAPVSGWSFIGWSGGASGTANPLVVTLTSNLAITANFTSAVPDLIVDNTNATFTGSWTTDTASDNFEVNYQYAETVDGSATATATFTPTITTVGNYDVYVWYPTVDPSYSSAAVPHLVSYDGGSTNVIVSQQSGAGSWQLIASGEPFAAGTSGSVWVSNNTGQASMRVAADAVKWVYSSDQYSPPVIIAQPQGQTGELGGNATFTVVAAGTPALAYQWLLNGGDISGATDSSYTLSNLQPANAGSYSVVITNVAGSVTSSNAILTLNALLTITDQPTNLTVCAGAPAVFSVGAIGLDLTYQWQGSGDGGLTFTNISSAATNASYTNPITAVADDGYQYQVIVVSGASSLSVTSAPPAVLTVNAPAVADAGLDQTVCADSPATVLAGAFSGTATTATWSGDGTFAPNAETLNAVYTPTPAEIAAGTDTVTLTTDDPAGPCGAAIDTMLITIEPAATVDAGPDQIVSASSPDTTLTGAFGGAATSATWSGAGTFTPNAATLNAVYTPTTAEIAAGTATVTLTTDDPSGLCGAVNDSMTITINSVSQTSATITSISGTTLEYTGGSGAQFVLLKSADATAPLGSWSREATNTVTPGTFTIPAVGTDTSAFYSIKSE